MSDLTLGAFDWYAILFQINNDPFLKLLFHESALNPAEK